jgi:hypothetical protein
MGSMGHDLLARKVPCSHDELEFLEKSEIGGTGKFAFSVFVQTGLHGQTEVPITSKTRGMTVEDVRRFHASTFRSGRAILGLVSGFDPNRAREVVEKVFGAIPEPRTELDRPRPRPESNSLTARKDAASRHPILAWTTPPASSPERVALSLASLALMHRLATDRDIAAMERMPMVTNEVESYYLINVQVKPGADPGALKAKLLEQVGSLPTAEGFGDLQVA